jgi:microcystin-dependent protein
MTRLKTTGAAVLLSALPFAAQACNAEPYIGTVCTFTFDWCPSGYLPADGRALNIREYTALFGLIGFSYGGDSKTLSACPICAAAPRSAGPRHGAAYQYRDGAASGSSSSR